MAYKSKSEKTGKKLAEETHDIWKTYSKKREMWANHAQEDREFRLGTQWTADQKRILEDVRDSGAKWCHFPSKKCRTHEQLLHGILKRRIHGNIENMR